MYRENAVYKVNHLIQIHIQIFFCCAHLQNITSTIFTEITWNTKREEIKQLIQRACEKRAALCTHYECLPIVITKISLPNMNFQNILCNLLTADVKMSTHVKPLKLARVLKSTQRTHYYILKTWAYPSVTLSRQFIFYQLLNQTDIEDI